MNYLLAAFNPNLTNEQVAEIFRKGRERSKVLGDQILANAEKLAHDERLPVAARYEAATRYLSMATKLLF